MSSFKDKVLKLFSGHEGDSIRKQDKIKSKEKNHALQRVEMVELMYLWMLFYSERCRPPSVAEWGKMWEDGEC